MSWNPVACVKPGSFLCVAPAVQFAIGIFFVGPERFESALCLHRKSHPHETFARSQPSLCSLLVLMTDSARALMTHSIRDLVLKQELQQEQFTRNKNRDTRIGGAKAKNFFATLNMIYRGEVKAVPGEKILCGGSAFASVLSLRHGPRHREAKIRTPLKETRSQWNRCRCILACHSNFVSLSFVSFSFCVSFYFASLNLSFHEQASNFKAREH